jgi:hypothetical protein
MIYLWGFMKPHLRRAGHTVVPLSANHGFPSAHISLHFDLKWPPPEVGPFSHMRATTAYFHTNESVDTDVGKPPLHVYSRRWIFRKPFSDCPLTTKQRFVFTYSVMQDLFSLGDAISENWIAYRLKHVLWIYTDNFEIFKSLTFSGPPLCSSGQTSWLQTQRSALPYFQSSSRSGTGSTQILWG